MVSARRHPRRAGSRDRPTARKSRTPATEQAARTGIVPMLRAKITASAALVRPIKVFSSTAIKAKPPAQGRRCEGARYSARRTPPRNPCRHVLDASDFHSQIRQYIHRLRARTAAVIDTAATSA
jgi:hypothetical protein